MKHFTKEHCVAAVKRPTPTLRLDHPAGGVEYKMVGSDDGWSHFYCPEFNHVRTLRRKHLSGKRAAFPRLEDFIAGEMYSPE